MKYGDLYRAAAYNFPDRWDEEIAINLNGEKYALEVEEVKSKTRDRRFELKLVKLEN